MKTLTLALFILAFSFSAYGQPVYTRPSTKKPTVKTVPVPTSPNYDYFEAKEKCSVKTADFNKIRGLKIGMSEDEIKQIFPDMELKDSSFPPIKVAFVHPENIANYREIKRLYLTFIDASLVSFDIDYFPIIVWDSILEYKNQIADTLKLRREVWSITSDKEKMGVGAARCEDFVVYVSLLTVREQFYSVRVEKKDYYSDALEKERNQKERQKKEFKP